MRHELKIFPVGLLDRNRESEDSCVQFSLARELVRKLFVVLYFINWIFEETHFNYHIQLLLYFWIKLETCGSLEQENKNIVATSKSCSKSDQAGDDWLVVDLKLDFLQQKSCVNTEKYIVSLVIHDHNRNVSPKPQHWPLTLGWQQWHCEYFTPDLSLFSLLFGDKIHNFDSNNTTRVKIFRLSAPPGGPPYRNYY